MAEIIIRRVSHYSLYCVLARDTRGGVRRRRSVWGRGPPTAGAWAPGLGAPGDPRPGGRRPEEAAADKWTLHIRLYGTLNCMDRTLNNDPVT